jgi:hypothetical protein
MDLRDGDIIMVSTHWGDPHPGVIAHEHRHFQQHYLTSLPRIGRIEPFQQSDTEGWERAIVEFYTRQPWEMDALSYQHRIAPGETSERSLALLIP